MYPDFSSKKVGVEADMSMCRSRQCGYTLEVSNIGVTLSEIELDTMWMKVQKVKW